MIARVVGSPALGRAFLAAWEGESDELDPARVGEILERGIQGALAQWPAVAVDGAVYAAFVAERVPVDADPEAAVAELQLADLYLACACRQGSEPAAESFREHVFETVRIAVRRVAPEATEDVINRLYDRLFLSDGETVPKIQGYRGQGDLRRWVSVVACRIAIDGRRREQTSDRLRAVALGRLVEQMQTLELDYLRGVYRDEFKQAFSVAVETLDERQRNVLRYQLEGLTADQVGRLYNVHRVTVARWLSRIRETLLDRTLGTLREKLGVGKAEADSILRLIEGEVSVSLGRLLAAPSGDHSVP